MADTTDDLAKAFKKPIETALDWATGDAPKRLIKEALDKRKEVKPEPFKFDGPKEKEEQRKQNSKKPVPRKRA
jgi:hypothetical protein